MKGKYANAAERRRYLAALEERTETAERARDAASRELGAYREKAEAEIGRLKERLADVMAQRDEGSSPEVAALTARNEELRRQLKESGDALKEVRTLWRDYNKGFHQYLMRVNRLTGSEALDVLLNCLPGKARPTYVTDNPKQKLAGDVKAELAISAARGRRHGRDVLADVFAELRQEPS